MKSITQADIKPGMKVFVRGDIDVPLVNGNIENTYRLDNIMPSLKFIIDKGATPILAGHLRQPHGKKITKLSTKHLKPYFDKHLGKDKYELLENLRFDIREEENSDEFAKELASLADIYVNESFATSHRKHASLVGVPKYLPAYAGLRFTKEIESLDKIIKNAAKPMIAIIGGAKIESKKPTIKKFLNIADEVLVGGRLGLDWDEEIPNNLHIPSDYADKELDIGPETIKYFEQKIHSAKTILWAGPLGAFEKPGFDKGTKEVGKAVVEATKNGAFSLIGGGNTIEALEKLKLLDKMSFVSTGGGSMLQYIDEGTLPAMELLNG